jgi:A/G-specific adenine glycosylase
VGLLIAFGHRVRLDLSTSPRRRPVDPATALLDWYRPRRRLYPWRSGRPDPYRILLSEVMLQQTQVGRVIPAFTEFVGRFPTVGSLAAAQRSEVLRAWSGLGYNRRAVNLSEAARLVVRDHGGVIPSDPNALLRLPGVGPYTAAAVASIAFGVSVPAVDTNVARVVARARLGTEPQETPKRAVQAAASAWLDPRAPAAWNQALMDLGRDVCRPVPRCPACPLSGDCRFRAEAREGAPARRPRPPFHGSLRQVRGAIMRTLGNRSSVSVGTLAKEIGVPVDRVTEALTGLSRDGLVEASAAALLGRLRGRVRLPEG